MELNVIKCPICGQEYHPSEIYYPDEFLGHPTDIVRDSAGKLDFIIGSDMNLEEEFTCENCNCKFYVKATVVFETSITKFNDQYVTKLKHKAVDYGLDKGINFDDINTGTEEQ